MADLYRYAAFISYSSKDSKFAQRLHRALESYGIPSSLGKFDLIGGGKQNRIYPVFRDREELSAGHLGEQIEANLKASAALIVVCSPNGAASPWVQKEIEFFAAQGRHAKIFAIIPETAPLTDEHGADCTQACFPPAFRGDALSGDKLEPLAADARKGKDGFRSAWLKIVAGMVGVSPGQIIDRDKKRRAQQGFTMGAGVTTMILGAASLLAWMDAGAWRSMLTREAEATIASGDPYSAASLALGGVPSTGALVSARARQADETLGLLAGAPIIAHVPNVDGVQFSNDGTLMMVARDDGAATLYDLTGELQPFEVDTDCHGRCLVLAGGRSAMLAAARINADSERISIIRARDRWQTQDIGEVQEYALSSDGQMLGTRTHDGNVHIYTMSGNSDPSVFAGVDDASMSPDGGTLLLVRGAGRGELVRDGQARDVGVVRPILFASKDGSRAVTVDEDGTLRLHDLDSGSSGQIIGPYGVSLISPPRFEANGRLLLVAASPQLCLVFETDLPTAPREIASGCQNVITDGVFVGWTTGDGLVGDGRFFAQDLRGRTSPVLLESYEQAQVSLPRQAFVSVSDSGNVLVRDFTGGRRINEIDRPIDWNLEGGGTVLVVIEQGLDGVIYPLDGRAPIRIGPYRRLAFSQDGERFVSESPDGLARLWSLSDPQHPRALGAIGGLTDDENGVGRFGDISLSPDGSILVVNNQDGSATVYDLAASAPGRGANGRSLAGANLHREFCSANGDLLAPVSTALRAQQGGLAVSLRGRPWNPCDWRGLLAIFPNPERGDGWFEGARQWLRLMQVRYLHGTDYSCPETTFAASEETRGRRRDMCDHYTMPQPAEEPT